MVIRVLVAAEQELLRAAFAALLITEPDIEVFAEAAAWDELARATAGAAPDVVLVDLDLDDPDGPSTVIRLCRGGYRALILAGANRHPVLAKLAAADVRDLGFLSVDGPADQVISAIRAVAAGEPVLDAEIAMAALAAPDSPLTEREVAVLGLAADGAPATEIADELGLSVSTVRNHLSRINGKTGARTRIEAVRVATAAGWL